MVHACNVAVILFVYLHAPYYKHPGIPILALTGTADDTTQSTICSELSLKANTCKLFISPNRHNIRVSVNKVRKEGMESQLDWLVELTKEQLEKTPKTIIFCNTLKDIASVVNLLLLKLREHAYVPVGSRNVEDLVIGIFHSVTWPEKKEKLMTEFRLQTKKRIVVASTALSMGVNFGDIRYVINWGPARNLLDELQEAGRAGRDGLRAHLIIVYHGQQLSQCEQEIKDFVKSEGCYRVAMYRPFDKNIKPVSPGHDCCSHCALECCGRCCAVKLPFEKSESTGQSVPALTRPVSNEDKSCLKEALTELVEGSCNNAFGAVSCHGFSNELVEDIINNCHRLFTVNDVFECLPVYSLDHCLKILEIIQEIYGDIPNFDDTSEILPLDGVEGGEWRMEYFDDYFDLPDDDTDDLDFIEL